MCIDTLRSRLRSVGAPSPEPDSPYHLLRPEFSCSRKRIRRLMKELKNDSAGKRACRVTTNSDHATPIAENLLDRSFRAPIPNSVWVGDITCIPTGEGWPYPAIVKDLCTGRVVGYAFSDRINTQLTPAALNAAVQREKPARGLSSAPSGAFSMPPICSAVCVV